MNKVSVIIPVYNASLYIIDCIDSLLCQTLKDLEIILVDDCSTDNSIELVKEHIKGNKQEENFIFLSTPNNSGPGIARNIGIQAATGKYIAFMDSDDTIKETMYEKLYLEAEAYNTDICYCNTVFIYPNNKRKILKNTSTNKGEFTFTNKTKFLSTFTTYICTYLYNREFLINNNLIFPKEKSSEDSNFLTKVIILATRISYITDCMYCYYYRTDSLTTTFNTKRHLDKVAAFDKLIEELKDRNLFNSFKEELEFIYLKKVYITGCLDYLKNTNNIDYNIIKNLKTIVQERFNNYKNNKYLKNSLKAQLVINCLNYKVTTQALQLFLQ